MRFLILVFCLFISFSVDAQKRKKKEIRAQQKAEFAAMAVLSQLGRTLQSYEVAATFQNEATNAYEWRFILAEESLRGKVDKNMASELTSFLFSFELNARKYNGEILQNQDEMTKNQILNMIYQHLSQNIRYYRGDLDFVRVDGKYYYVLYYPYKENSTNS